MICTLVVPQPNAPLTVAISPVRTVLLLTCVLVVAVQPLAFVSVTLYGPAVVAKIVLDITPVDQTAVPLPTAVRTTVGLAQVSVAFIGVMETAGAAVLL